MSTKIKKLPISVEALTELEAIIDAADERVQSAFADWFRRRVSAVAASAAISGETLKRVGAERRDEMVYRYEEDTKRVVAADLHKLMQVEHELGGKSKTDLIITVRLWGIK